MDKIGIEMHGVRLNFQANKASLLSHATEHFKGLAHSAFENPSITVNCNWINGPWDPEEQPFIKTDQPLRVLGKRMLGRKDELVWVNTLRVTGLQYHFRKSGNQFIFDVAYHFDPSKRKLAKLPNYESKKYFSLMSELIYYPMIWYLERTRGWTILHASALDTGTGAIAIGGLGGVGKTTTSVALMQACRMKLISENLIFTDGDFIYPCYEPIRLDPESLELLQRTDGLVSMDFPSGLKPKSLFLLDALTTPCKVPPKLIFLPQFSPKRYVARLEAESAFEKIAAMNRLTRELDDYYWFAAALDMQWPKPGLTQARLDALRTFVEEADCYELGIDRTLGVSAVVQDIVGQLHDS